MAKMIQKTTAYERFVHWTMALSCLVLLLTGLGFLYQQELGWLNTIFGGQHLARQIHNWGGVVFTISVIMGIGIWLGEALSWTKEDSEWIGMLGGYFGRDLEPPPQGKLNAGQKLVVMAVIFCGLLIAVSGFLMWIGPASKGAMLWGHILHNLAFLVFAVTVPVHIYMATAANPGTFRIMTRGDVPLYWARKKHARWVKETGGE